MRYPAHLAAGDHPGGFSLIDILVATMLLAVLAGTAIPPLVGGLAASRAVGVARLLAARFALARAQAASGHAAVGIVFAARDHDVWMSTYRDGNGNGVRSDEITAGVDLPLDGETVLSTGAQALAVAVANPDAPMVDGDTVLLSFSPTGTSSSASLYVTADDGTRYAVRVLGATGRVRVQRQDRRTNLWHEHL